MNEATEPQKILIVDDDDKNLLLMTSILKNTGCKLETAVNGADAVDMAKTFSPDMIFLDIMMPKMDGFEACKILKADPATTAIPVVMVTALADRESKLRGLDIGADDFLTKPIDPMELMLKAKNHLKVKEYADFLNNFNQTLKDTVRDRTIDLENALSELKLSKDMLKKGYVDTIHRLTTVAEFKDEDTATHIRRIAYYCRHIAKGLGWDEYSQEIMFYASPMHDIGKVGIPSDILLKPGRLTPEEFSLMKTHTTIGAKILKGSDSYFLQTAEKIALSHHERWDGNGYPNSLKGEDIPIEARIMNIADQYDALRSTRPYKIGLSHERTVDIITNGDGRTMPGHFDPEILKVFNDTQKVFDEIYNKQSD